MPRSEQIELDTITVAFTAAVGAATVFAGFIPAFMVIRSDKDSSASPAVSGNFTRSGLRARQALIAVQVALVLPLLVISTLLWDTYRNLLGVDLGFQSTDIVVAELRVLKPSYRDPLALRTFELAIIDRVRQVPGVKAVTLTSAVPFSGMDWMRTVRPPAATPILANERQVEPNFFDVMNIRLLEGRLLEPRDTAAGPRVAVISSSLAGKVYPEGTAVGNALAVAGAPLIVGVVSDVRTRQIQEAPTPAYYVPRAQSSSDLICVVAKIGGVRADATLVSMASRIREVDPEQPLHLVNTLSGIVNGSVQDRRLYAITSVTFGFVALLLILVGMSGVVSQFVSERTREIGVRASVGATPVRLMWFMTRLVMTPVVVGLLIGAFVSFGAATIVRGTLFGVGAMQSWPYLLGLATVLLSTTAACVWSGRGIVSLDLSKALKHS
jgi:putative ABC transport system permease protein